MVGRREPAARRVQPVGGGLRRARCAEVRARPGRDAALAPTGRSFILAQEAAGRGQLWVVPRIRPDGSAARRLFAGAGAFEQIAWSPDGRWVLAGWSTAHQWVFLRGDGSAIRAVANVSEQFRSKSFPRVEGWCCAP
jgi:hypothetical protein